MNEEQQMQEAVRQDEAPNMKDAEAVTGQPDNQVDPYFAFQNELAAVINSHSIENRTNTPDFILAELIVENLRSLEHFQSARHAWHEFRSANIEA